MSQSANKEHNAGPALIIALVVALLVWPFPMFFLAWLFKAANWSFPWVQAGTGVWYLWLVAPLTLVIFFFLKMRELEKEYGDNRRAKLQLEIARKIVKPQPRRFTKEETDAMSLGFKLGLGLKARQIASLSEKSASIYAETKDSSDPRFVQVETQIKNAIADFWDSVSFVLEFDGILKGKPASWKDALDW